MGTYERTYCTQAAHRLQVGLSPVSPLPIARAKTTKERKADRKEERNERITYRDKSCDQERSWPIDTGPPPMCLFAQSAV
mmetsp:Transcript_28815/g.56467  ORF Transcript_28815/g.56467 Transcript_28815/m.56467 type:complete len:80 (+) Transcript_28815:130-369(+)